MILVLLAMYAFTLTAAPFARVDTHPLPENTHRPEILALPDGGILVVVVQPDGPQGVGRVKHKAYRFDANWNRVGEPFAVTRITAEFGEPADHRAAIVNGELVVIYQSLVFNGAPPLAGPAENIALEQSLMLSRFTLEGEELDRRPIVAHQKDFFQDNFPDFCILWRQDRFLVGAGSMSRTLKIREVDLNGTVLATHVLTASPTGIGGTIGNSLLDNGSQLFLLSSTAPESGALTATEIGADFSPGGTVVLSDPSREQSFPVGNLFDSGSTFIAYISRARGGPNDLLQNPYSPYLKILSPDFEVLQDLKVGDGGFAHVHPTVIRFGSRLLVAWSKALDLGDRQAPQVQIEEYEEADRQ